MNKLKQKKLVLLIAFCLSLIIPLHVSEVKAPEPGSIQSVTLVATDDAFVREATGWVNYGSLDWLTVGNESSTLYRSWLKFSLSGIPAGSYIKNATLSLWCFYNASMPVLDVNFHSNDTWSENTITWDNAPYGNGTTEDTITPVADSWSNVTVTSRLRSEYNLGSNLTYLLKLDDETQVAYAQFNATERLGVSVTSPFIVVYYAASVYTFHGLYDETTGLRSGAVNVTAYFTGGVSSETFEVNGTLEYWTNNVPLYFWFNLTVPREYWVGNTETNSTIYIFDKSLTSYTIEFVDLAGALDDYPFVTAQRYINGTLYTVEKRRVDEEKKIQMALVNGEKYNIIVQDGSSYTFGDWLFTSTTTITLTLKGIEFPQNIILAYRYVRLYAQRHNNFTSISMLYEDTENNTDHVDLRILYRNGTVAYSNTQTGVSSFNVTWTSALYNTTYRVEMDAVHNTYGTLNYRAVMYRGGFATSPWGLDWLGSIANMQTSTLIPIFLIFAGAAIFSKVNAYVAGFTVWLLAVLMAWWGWISIDPRMLILALIAVILMGLAAKKKRTVGA